PNRRLREHVRHAVFTSERLLAVMRNHGLYASLLRTNPRAALESFQEDIVIDVYRNYFIEERAPSAPPRSARIAVGYRSPLPLQSVAVARDLGKLVAEHEGNHRHAQALRAARVSAQAAAMARTALHRRQQE